jgi:hypothetical protein
MLTAAAICPHPPLLVAEATGGTAGPGDADLSRLRAACGTAARTLALASPDVLVVVGGAERTARFPAAAAGSLRDYGVPFTIGDGPPVLPLSLTIGRWLLAHAVHAQPVLQAVATRAPPDECLILGASLAALAPAVAILVLADGPARRARGIPNAIDADADRYDKQIANALGSADAGQLADLDPGQDDALCIAGRAAWQVLAGAALADAETDSDARFTARLRYAAVPFEVSYFVATWTLAH